jgi:hypothetical protein
MDALTSDSFRKVGTAAGGQNVRMPIDKSRETFKKRAAYLNSMRDPNTAMAEVEKRVGSSTHAPQISAALAAQFVKTNQFLADKLPTDPLAQYNLNFYKSSWEPSDYQLAEFHRYVHAAEDPTSVLDDIAAGSVTPEQIETLKTLQASMYKRLQDGLMDAIMDENLKLSYEQRLNISTLLDVPTDPTLAPAFVSTMQQNYANEATPTQPGQPQKSPRKIHLELDPSAIATDVSRLTFS